MDQAKKRHGNTVHQCARFCADPKAINENAVKHIVRYLLTTKPKTRREQPMYGLHTRPAMSRGLEVFVNASFAGDWQQVWSVESSSLLSRTGFIIKYDNRPIVWTSKLQTEIALNTTEAEHIAMSHAMREAILLMRLLNEAKGSININMDKKADFKCTVFEDNN
eukprot:2670271-Ditylum_brightwellii.AAC.1